MAGERRRYCVGVTKIPFADRDVAHAVMSEDDPRGFFDIIGADTGDDDERFPVGSRCTYRVELTDEEAAAFAEASNCRYIHLDGYSSETGGVAQFPSWSTQMFMGMTIPGLDEKWHGRDVTVAVLDSGVTGPVIGYMDWTLVGRAEFQDDALRADGTTTDHGCQVASCAVPRGGRLLDAVITEQDGTASFSAEAAGMRWAADNGADIINMSHAGEANPGGVFTDALDYIEGFGVQAFFPAGNDDSTVPFYPAWFSTTYDNVHSSISWDSQTGLRAVDSNHNAAYSGAAPGVDVLGLTPDGTVVPWGGTSASSPHMAQLCARLCTGGTYTPEQAGAALKGNTRDLGVADSEQGGGAYDIELALDALGELPLTITTGRRNLMVNPSVELDTTGYSVVTRSGITHTAINTSSGTTPASGSLYAFTNITGNGSTSSSPDATLTWPTVDVVAGLEYSFTPALRYSILGTDLELQVEWLDADGDTVSTSTGDRTPMFIYGWFGYSLVDTAPEGATQAVLRMLGYGYTDTTARGLRWDATIVEETAPGDPVVVRGYFDGDSEGADWDGDPEESTSVLGPEPLEVLSGSAELVWTPPEAGVYVLRYEATNAVGSDSDDITVTVAVPAIEGVLDGTLPLPAAAFEGDVFTSGVLDGTLPLPTAALTGTASTSGILAGTLLIPTADLDAATSVPGELGALLPLVTAALTGTTANTGMLGAALPLPTADLTGATAAAGVLAGQLPIPTADLGAASSASGTLAATLPLPAADLDATVAAAGELDASLPLPTAALEGDTANSGTLSGTLPVPLANLSGTLRDTGELDATLPFPTAALTGDVGGAGVLNGTLPLPTAELEGDTSNPGVLDANLPLPTGALTGGVTGTGVLDGTLPLPIAFLGGDGSATGVLAATLPLPTAELMGETANPGVLDATLPLPTAAITGTVAQTGTLAATLPLPTAMLSADGSARGQLDATLPIPTAAIEGTTANPGQLDSALPLPTAALTGTVTQTGALDGTLPLPTATLIADGSNTGTLTAALPTPTASLDGDTSNPGVLGGTLPMPEAALSGDVAGGGVLDGTLPMPAAGLDGDVATTGVLGGTLPLPTADLGAGGGNSGTLDATLPMLGADLSGGITVVAVIHGVLPLVTASLTAGVTASGTLGASLPMPTAALTGTTGDQESRLDATLPMPVAALVGASSTTGVLSGVLPLPTAALTDIPPATYEPPLRAGQPVWATERLRAGQPDLTGGLIAGAP